jgi:hypothetical protein
MAPPLPPALSKDELPRELLELRARVELLPELVRVKLLPLCEKLAHISRLQARMVHIAQDAVDQLQFDIKYLVFDLEATRRERDAYKQELEELKPTED